MSDQTIAELFNKADEHNCICGTLSLSCKRCALWSKAEREADKLQSRLTAAETRIKELEQRRIRLFIICDKCNVEFEIHLDLHNVCVGEHRCSNCGTLNMLWARAELDKLKGKS